jgi:hypothetical protein
MGLFDGYFEPQQFADSGGLLGRLLSLRPDLAQNQRQDTGFDQLPSAPQAPAHTPLLWPTLPISGSMPFAPQLPAQDLHSQLGTITPCARPSIRNWTRPWSHGCS